MEHLTTEELVTRSHIINLVTQLVDEWMDKNVPFREIQQRDLSALSRYLGTQHKVLIDTLIESSKDKDKYPDRPMILIYDACGKIHRPDIWLLCWRKGETGPEGTDIHDHGKSEVGIYVYEGAVRERIYGFDADELKQIADYKTPAMKALAADRWMEKGSSVTIGAPYIHLVDNCPEQDCSITIHSYYPPLREMVIFDEIEEQNLLVYREHWEDERFCVVKPPHVVPRLDDFMDEEFAPHLLPHERS